MLKLLGWNLGPFNFLSENMSFCFFHLHMCIKGFSWIPSDKFRKISPVSLNKAETKPFVRRCFEYESNVTQNLLAGTYSYAVSSTKSWCQLCLVDFCGSAELHHIRVGCSLSLLSYVFFSSPDSLACAAASLLLCTMTQSSVYLPVHTLTLLFNSCGMCAPEWGAGEVLSSWVGTQRILHILSAIENRNQDYVSRDSSHWCLWSSAEAGEWRHN